MLLATEGMSDKNKQAKAIHLDCEASLVFGQPEPPLTTLPASRAVTNSVDRQHDVANSPVMFNHRMSLRNFSERISRRDVVLQRAAQQPIM